MTFGSNWDNWFSKIQTNPAAARFIALGDSTTEGDVTATNGGWTEQLRQLSEARLGRHGDGIHLLNRDYWVFAGTWTRAATTDAWDIAPNNGAFAGSAAFTANGASNLLTWTNPSLTVQQFTIYAIDAAGAGTFSYRVNGGAWTDIPTVTWSAGNTIKTFTINGSIGSTIAVRAANAAGTAVNLYMIGGEPINRSNGLTLHDFGSDGDALAYITNPARSGHWNKLLDLIAPDVVSVMFFNDWYFENASPGSYRTALDTLGDYVVNTLGAGMLYVGYWDDPTATVSPTLTATMRAECVGAAAALGSNAAVIDLAVAEPNPVAAGYQAANDVHESNAGSTFIAQQVWNLLASNHIGARFK